MPAESLTRSGAINLINDSIDKLYVFPCLLLHQQYGEPDGRGQRALRADARGHNNSSRRQGLQA